MLKEPSPQQHELEMVSLESLVPDNHLLRKIDQYIDFEFIRDRVRHLYCLNNGRPALDPVVLFKMLFLGYLFGIRSERQLVREIQVNVAYRWFLRFNLTYKTDASTLSQNRRRRFQDSSIYQEIFDEIVFQAMGYDLVGGEVLYTDSTHLKANANKNKYDLKQAEEQVAAYLGIEDAIEDDRKTQGKKPLKTKLSEQPKTKDAKIRRTIRTVAIWSGRQAQGLLLPGPPHRRWPQRHHHRQLRHSGQLARQPSLSGQAGSTM